MVCTGYELGLNMLECGFTHNSKEPLRGEKKFIMPGHNKIIMPAQQPIRARALLLPHDKGTIMTDALV